MQRKSLNHRYTYSTPYNQSPNLDIEQIREYKQNIPSKNVSENKHEFSFADNRNKNFDCQYSSSHNNIRQYDYAPTNVFLHSNPFKDRRITNKLWKCMENPPKVRFSSLENSRNFTTKQNNNNNQLRKYNSQNLFNNLAKMRTEDRSSVKTKVHYDYQQNKQQSFTHAYDINNSYFQIFQQKQKIKGNNLMKKSPTATANKLKIIKQVSPSEKQKYQFVNLNNIKMAQSCTSVDYSMNTKQSLNQAEFKCILKHYQALLQVQKIKIANQINSQSAIIIKLQDKINKLTAQVTNKSDIIKQLINKLSENKNTIKQDDNLIQLSTKIKSLETKYKKLDQITIAQHAKLQHGINNAIQALNNKIQNIATNKVSIQQQTMRAIKSMQNEWQRILAIAKIEQITRKQYSINLTRIRQFIGSLLVLQPNCEDAKIDQTYQSLSNCQAKSLDTSNNLCNTGKFNDGTYYQDVNPEQILIQSSIIQNGHNSGVNKQYQQLDQSLTYFIHPNQLPNFDKIIQLFQLRQQKPVKCTIDQNNRLKYSESGTFIFDRCGNPLIITQNQLRYYADRGFIICHKLCN